MLHEALEDIDTSFLRDLCANHCPESDTLDFKQSLPGSADKDKQEFLKDICAFANATHGGDIVYGIAEEGAASSSLTPITNEASDASAGQSAPRGEERAGDRPQ